MREREIKGDCVVSELSRWKGCHCLGGRGCGETLWVEKGVCVIPVSLGHVNWTHVDNSISRKGSWLEIKIKSHTHVDDLLQI